MLFWRNDKFKHFLPAANAIILMLFVLWSAGSDDLRVIWMIPLLWAVVISINFSHNLWRIFMFSSVVLIGLVLFTIICPPKRHRVHLASMSKAINEFHKCWTPKDYKNCAYASTELRAITPDSFLENSAKISRALGSRISGEVSANIHAIESKSEVNGQTVEALYTNIQVVYGKDKYVTEGYQLIFNRYIGHYQVNAFQIRSKLLKLDVNI